MVDSERMLALMSDAGIEIKNEPFGCDAAIINTCGFIESAKSEAIENILDMARLKQAGEVKSIIVTGCLAQRYKDEILTELPEVDAVCGTGSYHDIVEIVTELARSASEAGGK